MEFFGRENELAELGNLWGKLSSSLVTCRGRRRIGKSTLITEFAKKSKARFIRIEGIRPQEGYSNETELATFAAQLSSQTSADGRTPQNWLEAFLRLDEVLVGNVRTVVLLDEVSWLAHYDKTFADVLKIVWDGHWSLHDRLVVVLCGSVSSWIKEHIIDNGSFLGRRSLDMVVRELPLTECVKFWGRAAKRIDPREIIDVLSVTGGVPRYLREINPSLSASENIRLMAFSPNTTLRTDFEEMFSDVITRQPTLTGRILRALVNGSGTVSDIAESLKTEKGGWITDLLRQLEEAGLVSSDAGVNPETGREVRERCYRISDNYSRFYLKYIEPAKAQIDRGGYAFVALDGLAGWDAVMGYQFENLVINNYAQLLKPLHLDNALIESAAPYRRTGSAGSPGLQIDFLIQTAHANVVVEIKRMREIGLSVAREVADKISRFKRPRGKSFRPVLIYDGVLSPRLETDGYFDLRLPFSQLLGL